MTPSCQTAEPRAFSLVVGVLVVAEGIKLTNGMYLVLYFQERDILYMSEDQMCSTVENGAKLRWAQPRARVL